MPEAIASGISYTPNEVFSKHDSKICIQLYLLVDSIRKLKILLFTRCEKLESISLQCTITFIGDKAFEDCKALAHINIPASTTNRIKEIMEKNKDILVEQI